jgi:replicative DNA helicase
LQEVAPNIYAVEAYADIVRKKAVRRALIRNCNEILDDAYHSDMEDDDLLESAEQRILKIGELSAGKKPKSFHELAPTAVARVEAIQRGERPGGLSFGIASIDEVTALYPSELSLAAARTSVGKTSFAIQIANHVANHHEIPVLFFSLEQSADEVVGRTIIRHCRIDSWRWRSAMLQPEEWDSISRGLLRRGEPSNATRSA